MTMSGTGPGHSVDGYAADAGAGDPHKPYPTSNPTSGYTRSDESFAGIIYGQSGNDTLRLFCIDLHTSTWSGIGYKLGDWDAADVPNVGYVARVLNEYYPNTGEPAALQSDSDKAAAVQAAIWYFSDGYVLAKGDPLHDAVAAIVGAVQGAGPIDQPKPPTLSISPSSATGLTGHAVGPFTVNSSVDAKVSATGASMFKDAGATQPLNNGDTVPGGTQIWLKSGTVGTATLSAVASADVPTGNVYLYNGNTPGVNSAQKLILAQTTKVQTTVTAQAEFQAFGSLEVDKTITGTTAGKQGPITIHVSCDKGPALDDITIPAGAKAPQPKTYTEIPAGAVCTVTETADGHTEKVAVAVDGSGQTVTVPANGTVKAGIIDTYSVPAPGSLIVHKTISGAGAGQQGPVTIHVVCDETPDSLTPDWIIPAGKPAGTLEHVYSNIPAGAVCTVTEMVNGTNSSVTVQTTGSGATTTVPTGSSATAELTDDYRLLPGSLLVQKSITGDAAGRQGEITISVDCGENGPDLADWVIPAGTKAGSPSHTYGPIPAGIVCTVTETEDGHTNKVSVVVTNDGKPVTIPAGRTATVTVSDLYTDVPGSLVVRKTIAGVAAGKQGAITIVATCDGKALAPFVIPAKTDAGTVSHEFSPIAAGADCAVAETVDGHTSTVAVVIKGGDEVTIPAADTATTTLTDSYTDTPGTLVVNKTIAGNAAGHQGPVTIGVTCSGKALADFDIPAGADAGTLSKTYTGIAAGSTCTIDETADGHTSTVSVKQVGSDQVTVSAGGAATASLTDTYSNNPGTFVVSKTIAGPAAGSQGEITIVSTCDGVQLPPFVIPAGKDGGDVTHTYTGIAAGANCTAVESEDGHTATVGVKSSGSNQSVQVPANGTATASLSDTYSPEEGSLIVEKAISGDAAGSQGAITIQVSCDKGTPALPDFDIDPGAGAGSLSHTYPGLPAGATCSVDETADGGTSTVHVDVTIGQRQATIAAGDSVTLRLADVYGFAQPELTVEKEIVPATTPSGADVPVKLTVANTGKVEAKKVTVCLRLNHSLAFVKTSGGRLVRNGACWRVLRIVPKAEHKVAPVARSFNRHVRVVACNRVTLEVRGVDLHNVRACTVVLAVEVKKGGVTKKGSATKKSAAAKKGGAAKKAGGVAG
jgi:TQXA domain-containing protein